MADPITLETLTGIVPEGERLTCIESVRWLYERAREIGPGGLCVELGSWCGWTTCALALGGPAVLAVDTFLASDEFVRRDGALGRISGSRSGTLDRFARNVAMAQLARRVVAVQTRSVEAAQAVGDQTVDLVFVDADHTLASVTADLLAWSPRIKPGGLLCGDNWDIGDVQRAAQTVLAVLGWPAPSTSSATGQLWWTRRPQ